MLDALGQVEKATLLLEQHALSFAFPVKGMMMKHWTEKPLPTQIMEVKTSYEQALASVRAARGRRPLQSEKHWTTGLAAWSMGFST